MHVSMYVQYTLASMCLEEDAESEMLTVSTSMCSVHTTQNGGMVSGHSRLLATWIGCTELLLRTKRTAIQLV